MENFITSRPDKEATKKNSTKRKVMTIKGIFESSEGVNKLEISEEEVNKIAEITAEEFYGRSARKEKLLSFLILCGIK